MEDIAAIVAPLCSGLAYVVGVALAAIAIVKTSTIGED
jgi:hypothetical protein